MQLSTSTSALDSSLLPLPVAAPAGPATDAAAIGTFADFLPVAPALPVAVPPTLPMIDAPAFPTADTPLPRTIPSGLVFAAAPALGEVNLPAVAADAFTPSPTPVVT